MTQNEIKGRLFNIVQYRSLMRGRYATDPALKNTYQEVDAELEQKEIELVELLKEERCKNVRP